MSSVRAKLWYCPAAMCLTDILPKNLTLAGSSKLSVLALPWPHCMNCWSPQVYKCDAVLLLLVDSPSFTAKAREWFCSQAISVTLRLFS